jgi:hypothetical protein
VSARGEARGAGGRLACAYRLRPGAPLDEPIKSFGAFVEHVDQSRAFYGHLLAHLRRRWAVEHASLWDTLGSASGLKDAAAVERSIFGRSAFVVSPAAAWPTPFALRAAAALRRLVEQRHEQDNPRKPPRPRLPTRPPSRPPARTQLEVMWRQAGEQLRELEQAGNRLYVPVAQYREWLPSWTPPRVES